MPRAKFRQPIRYRFVRAEKVNDPDAVRTELIAEIPERALDREVLWPLMLGGWLTRGRWEWYHVGVTSSGFSIRYRASSRLIGFLEREEGATNDESTSKSVDEKSEEGI
jgi:hypothetical protein